MNRYYHTFDTNTQRSQYEGGGEYVTPYTSLVYEDYAVYYNVAKARFVYNDGNIVDIHGKGNLTSVETSGMLSDVYKVYLLDECTGVANAALSGCTMKYVEIADSVKSIGDYAMDGC